MAERRKEVPQWVPFIGLAAMFIASTGYMTSTLNKRIDDVDRHLSGRMDRMEAKIDALDEKIDALDEKIDALDEKFDRLLIALAGRGIGVPAKDATGHAGGKP